jgi:monofunctional biosynthetic peptidoglycan transglycosylase
MAPSRQSRRRSVIGRVLRLLAVAIFLILLLPYVLTPIYRIGQPVSTLMLWRWATGQRVERQWMPIAKISSALPLAVLVAEDARFCSHHGIDFEELQQAIEEADDISEARGGSTITQQTAKNLFLWNSRSFVRKALEFPLALWIDLVLPKRRILEIYLNIVEWGPTGEFGAEAGARRAFARSAAELTRPEAALLASVLPNPYRRDARRPGPGLRRLTGRYQRRSAAAPEGDDCLRLGH